VAMLSTGGVLHPSSTQSNRKYHHIVMFHLHVYISLTVTRCSDFKTSCWWRCTLKIQDRQSREENVTFTTSSYVSTDSSVNNQYHIYLDNHHLLTYSNARSLMGV